MTCGVYRIRCVVTGGIYVGSSHNIPWRWKEHRALLRRGKSNSLLLQRAWKKHGEDAFDLAVLELCTREERFIREQFWIDKLKPALNFRLTVFPIADLPKEVIDRRNASIRARAAKITHCPHGHLYDDQNTYRNKDGTRICRACNADRVGRIYAAQDVQAREQRRKKARASHLANRAERLAQQRDYVLAHKAEKQKYDREHRPRMNQLRNAQRAVETPERRAIRLAIKRESYYRNR